MFAFQEQQDKLNKFLIHQLVLKAAYTLTVEFCGNKVSNFYQVCNFDNAGFGLILEMAMYGICAIGGLAIYRTVIIREKPDHQYCKFLQMQRRFVPNKVDNLGHE